MGMGSGPEIGATKCSKKVFRNPVAQWMFGVMPPYMGMGLASYFSKKSREATGKHEEAFLGEENEWLISFSKEVLKQHHYDYLIFGHRHLPIDFSLKGGSRYINLGDWIRYYTYAVFDGQKLELRSHYAELENKIIRQ